MTLAKRLERIRHIADQINSEQLLSDQDREFITRALTDIADGQDPSKALDVKAKRGERRSNASRQQARNVAMRKHLAMGWIATAKAPVNEGGLGLTLDKACGMIGENDLHAFGLTEETLKTYWNKTPDLRQITFELPDLNRDLSPVTP